ncbi:S-layer homology domain-containing protein, partial [Frankia sp. Cpl3]|nr:S-layer homology domain-containing protein [Frankia sp. Cpl3]
GGTGNSIATAQALLALSDVKRNNSYLSLLREKSGNKKLARLSDLTTSYWAYKEISQLVRTGYMQGVTATRMNPDGPVTRAQFAALLLRAVGEEPNPKAQGLFADIAASDWAAPVVEKASALGLMQGDNGRFRPHQGITQEEMAVIASRVAKRFGWTKTYAGAATTVSWKAVSTWAEAGVKDLQSRKLLGGTKSKRFVPKAAVTRAEAAVMLARLLATR